MPSPIPVGTPTPDQIGTFGDNSQLDTQILGLVQEWASVYGVPWQVVAGVLISEIKLDTDIKDTFESAFFQYFGHELGDLYVQYWREDPGPGIGNVHVSTAKRVSEYFSENYSDNWRMQLPGYQHIDTATAAAVLAHDYHNTKAVAAYVRMLADYRFGSDGQPLQTDHSDLSKWTLTDAAAVWHGYRYGVPDGISPGGQGFKNIDAFQDRSYSWSEGVRRSVFIGIDAGESINGAIPFLQCYLIGCD